MHYSYYTSLCYNHQIKMPFLLDTSWDNGMAQLIKHILTGKGLGIVIMAEAHPSRALQPSTSHSPGACQSKQVRGKVSSKDQTWPGLWCISTHLSPRQSVFRAWAPILFTLYPPTHTCVFLHAHAHVWDSESDSPEGYIHRAFTFNFVAG